MSWQPVLRHLQSRLLGRRAKKQPRAKRKMGVELLEDRANPAPMASVTGLTSLQPLLGEAVGYSLTFTNTGDQPGFAPFIELAVDATGEDGDGPTGPAADDGFGVPVVTAAGLALAPVATIDVTGATFTNPFTNDPARPTPAGIGAGDRVYVYALPFGSFNPTQSTAITVSLPTSNLADVNQPLELAVTGGYRSNNASLTPPPIYGNNNGNPNDDAATAQVRPQLYRLNKIYLGPESETATGPNFVRRYRIEVDIAPGVTASPNDLRNVRVVDTLADSMRLVGLDSNLADIDAGPGTDLRPNVQAFAYNTPGVATDVTNLANLTYRFNNMPAALTGPGGELTYNFGNKTGVAGVDFALEFNFYVPRDDAGGAAVVAQGTDSTTAVNTAAALANWTPLDARDAPVVDAPPATSGSTLQHTLEQQSIAVQKSVAAVDPTTGLAVAPGAPIRPGQTLLRYTIDFQVSDYFAFEDLILRDVLSDGQRLFIGTRGTVNAFPTMTVNNAYLTGSPNGSRTNTSGAFQGGQVIEYQRRYTAGNPLADPTSFPADGPAAGSINPGVFRNLGASVQPDGPTSDAGSTFLQFNISEELIARLMADAGRLVGGDIGNDGTGPFDNAYLSQLFGGTTGQIVFYTEVTEEFSDEFLAANGGSGDQSVDQGDVLGNTVDDPRTGLRDGIFGEQLAADTINAATPAVIGRGSDDSGAGVSIPYGAQSKTIYAINGQQVPAQQFSDPPYAVQAGDRVTYLLTYTLPISSFENLRLIDFPPLPVMDVDAQGAFTFIRDPAAYGFLPGQVGVLDAAGSNATDDTYFATFDPALAGVRNPTVATDSATNSITLDFSSNDDLGATNHRFTQISVLVTLRLSNDAFASDLFLTNQLRVVEGSTNAGNTTVEAIQRVEYVRPFVTINKGAVAANDTGLTGAAGGSTAAFAPASDPAGTFTLNGVTFGPGTANPLDSASEAAAIGGIDIDPATLPVDAGDRVRYAIVVQNVGEGDAFDVRIRDQIPTQYERAAFDPATDLRVYRGDGTLLTPSDYTITYTAGTGQFEIVLTDDYTAGNVGGPTQDARSGGLSRGLSQSGPITNGSNTVVVLYDVTLTGDVTPNETITNTASVQVYSNSDGGPNFTDPAQVGGGTVPNQDNDTITKLPLQQKELIGTEIDAPSAGNGATQATVGELVTYRVTITIPEGVVPNAAIVDTLDAGLAFVDITGVQASGGLGFTGGGLPSVSGTPANTVVSNDGRTVTFNLGTITNADRDNAVAETIVITYRAVVLNALPNQAGQQRNNSARFTWEDNPDTLAPVSAGQATGTDGTVGNTAGGTGGDATATPVTLVEPTLTVAKDVRNVTEGGTFGQTATGDNNDTVAYRVTITNASGGGNTTANDLVLNDQIPARVSDPAVFGTVTVTGTVRLNGTPVTSLAATDFTITGNLLTFAPGVSIDMDPGSSIVIEVRGTFTGATGLTVTNTASVQWSSLDDDRAPTGANAAQYNAAGVERTGADGLPGANVLNDYRAQDTADIVSPPLVRKTVVATSEASTAGGRVAVGEVVRYRVYVSVGEGTTRNFQLRDLIPAGMSFLNDGSARFAFVSNEGGITSSSIGGPTTATGLTGPTVTGNGATLAGLTSAQLTGLFGDDNVFTSSSGAGTGDATIYADGQSVFFRFGDVTNADSDLDNEFIVIEFNALVRNVTGNQAGTNLDNTTSVLVDADDNGTAGYVAFTNDDGDGVRGAGDTPSTNPDDPNNNATGTPAVSAATRVTVAEPSVTINKQVIATTGTVVTYRVTVTNATGATVTTAFNAVITDTLNATDFTLVPGSVSAFAGTGFTGAADASSGNTVLVNIDSIAAGGSVAFTYQATVLRTLLGTVTLDNTARVTYTSLPGADGSVPFFGTVAATLGDPGTATGERTGEGGEGPENTVLNNYARSDTERLGSLGDRVWVDANGNGVQDTGEPGIVGATGTVRWAGLDGVFGTPGNDGDDSVIAFTTGADGIFIVGGLPVDSPGQFRVTIDAATGVFTTFGLNTQTFDADGAAGTPNQSTVSLTTTPTNAPNPRNQDFGYRGTASIGDTVWLDQNNNGVQDFTDANANGVFDVGEVGEPGIPNVTLTVTWHGQDGDLLTAADNVVYTVTTDANGRYLVQNLPAGQYTVVVDTTTLPDNLTQTYDLDGITPAATADRAGRTLATGEAARNVDFGYRGAASLGDTVWYDVNGNGVRENGPTVFEPGIANVIVTVVFGGDDGDLGTTLDNITFVTTTDANGFYQLSNIPGGDFLNGTAPNYRVTVSGVPAIYSVQTFDATGPTNDNQSTTRLESDGSVQTQDFGYRGPATQGLGNFVWHDLNGNGRQDGGEPGLNGVSVQLVGPGTDGVLGTGDDQVIAQTQTANVGGVDGVYSFPSLAAGNYRVRFGNTDGGGTTYARTAQNSPVAAADTNSDAAATGETGDVTVPAGATNNDVDAGLYLPVDIGDTVFYDTNGDGTQNGTPARPEPGITGVTVRLFYAGLDGVFQAGELATPLATRTTDASGNYLFADLAPGLYRVVVDPAQANLGGRGITTATTATSQDTTRPSGEDDLARDFGFRNTGSVGDRVFLDANGNNQWDAGEGLDGVTVTLTGDLNGDGTDETLTAVTAGDGFYRFDGLRVAPGGGTPYAVSITTADLPQDAAGTPVANTADPDNLPPGTTGDNTSVVTLTTGAPSNQAQDFGYRGAGSVGDRVFIDINNNGTYDAGEGVSGIDVTLTADVDNDDTDEAFTVTTGADGLYLFDNLPLRDSSGAVIGYTVTVDTADLPAGLTNTIDPDGGTASVWAGDLVSGPGNPDRRDVDFGYAGVGSVGDRVFLDVNGNGAFDAGEGLFGVDVTLSADLTGDGIPETFTVTTDADGFYLFDNLPVFRPNGTTPVSYTITVDTTDLPAGVANTVDPDGGTASAWTGALDAGPGSPDRRDVDFGYRGPGSLGDRVWIDSDGDGAQDAVALEPGLPGVRLTLTWSGADGVFGTDDDVTSTATTDALGRYTFGGLPLDQGRFRVVVDPATLPTNATQTFDLDGTGTPNVAGDTGSPAVTLTTANPNRTDVDFGYVGNASVGDRVYIDQDQDGFQDPSEPGIAGVTVRLTWGGPDGDLSTADDNVVFTTTTDAQGRYLFPGLMVNGASDDYRVEVVALPVDGLTLIDSLDDGTDGGTPSPAMPVVVPVSGTEGDPLNDRRDVDFGYDGGSTLAGTVFRDDNSNGVQDAGEPGIAGVRVTLTGVDLQGNPVLDPATSAPYVAVTDANGNYLFVNVIPGTYTLAESQPAAYNDGLDTSGTPFGGSAGNDVISGLFVGPNQDGTGYNFGERGTSLSGTVYNDRDRDGVRDPGEPGIPGVTVQVFTPGGTLVATVTTGPDGSYLIPDLPAGPYRVVETQPAGYGSTTPNVLDVTVPLAGLANVNFGEVLGRLSGTVYVDLNNNGVRNPNAGEAGIGGAVLRLVEAGTDGVHGTGDDVLVATTTTDAAGNYVFFDLFPGNYRVEEDLPRGYADGRDAVGTLGGGQSAAGGTDVVQGIVMPAGGAGANYNFGERPPSPNPDVRAVSGTVFVDDNRDGVLTAGERGIPGVTVQLLNQAGQVLGSQTTDANGNYAFNGLPPGVYFVRELQPNAYGNNSPNQLRADLTARSLANQNFAEVTSSLAGTVYFDANRGGTLTAGEPGLAGITVTLTGTDVNGTPVSRTTTTDASGNYLFAGLLAGTYTVSAAQADGYADGAETVGNFGGSTAANDAIAAVPVGAGQAAVGYNFGEVGVPVSGTVFLDRDRDGTLDAGEPGIGGVTIRLVDPDGNVVATTTTDAAGNYTFPNVAPGDYTIVEVQPAGYGDPQNGGPFAPSSRPVTVANTPVTGQNFGDTLSTLAGSVYVDANDDGVRDPGELGLGGVTVRLDSAGADGVFGTADDVTGFRTTTTGADGNYVFADLTVGTYRVVEVNQPSPFLDGKDTAGDAGGDARTNDVITAIPVAGGVDLGNYNFGELPPGPAGTTFIAGTVYVDTNDNGVQDPGEPGIAGVTVTLTGPGGGTLVTDQDGNYVFAGLMPGGAYTITESQPGQYATGQENAGNVIDVTPPAQGVTGQNFGELPGTITGTVYFDRDASGGLNGGDTPLAGVTVRLLDAAGNPVLDPVTGLPYAVTTDAGGNYTFTNLPAGTYRVVEVQPAGYNQGTNTPGTGAVVGGTDRLDVTLPPGGTSAANNFGELGATISGTVYHDRDRDGQIDAGEQPVAGVVVRLFDRDGNPAGVATTGPDGRYQFTNLPPGNYTIVQGQPANYANSPAGPSTIIPVALTPAGSVNNNFGEVLGSLSGSVYVDVNGNGLRDAAEPGIGRVTVTLTGTAADGTPVTRTATTDANGNYTFGDLPAGTYSVTETQPAGYADGLDRVGSVGGGVGNDTTTAIPLAAGVNAVNYDFGENGGSLSGFVYRDYNLNGVRNPNGANPDTGIGGITITLTGRDLLGNPVSRTTTTAADGSYRFDGLGAGVYTLRETQPPRPTDLTNGFYDGLDNVGSLGGTRPAKNALRVNLGTNQDGVNYNFGELPPADPFGFVFEDVNNNGRMDPGEPGIAGAAVTISGTAFAGTPFARPITAADVPGGSLTVLTDASGRWEFTPIPPGLYSVAEAQPAGFLDGREQLPANSGGAVPGNDRFDGMMLAPNPILGPFNFGELRPGSISGVVYIDGNGNGTRDGGEAGIPGVAITLTGTDDRGNPVSVTVTTGPDGSYRFDGLRPGTYTLTEAQPPGFDQGTNAPGTAGGSASGDSIGQIVLGPGQNATAYLFGELVPPPAVVLPPFAPTVTDPGVVISKQMFLASTQMPAQAFVPAVGLSPTFAASPGVAPAGAGSMIFATGSDAGTVPMVRVFDFATGRERFRFLAYSPVFTGGVRVATGDVTGDGVEDVVTATGVGGGPLVKVFDGRSGAEVAAFMAYSPVWTGGLFVAVGDVDGDGTGDIVTGVGAGGGPHVQVFRGGDFANIRSFFAYNPMFQAGVMVAAGDVDGDGFADVITGAGPGVAPHVQAFSGRDGSTLSSFFAFSPVFTGGVTVAAGDVNGDGRADIIAGAGPGGGPAVGVFDGATAQALASYFAFPPGVVNGGVRVATADADGDGRSEVIFGAGPGAVPWVRVSRGLTGAVVDEFMADGPAFLGGVWVG